MKLDTKIERFLYDNAIQGTLEKMLEQLKKNKNLSDDNLVNLWSDYHTLGDILQEIKDK